jgi:hypothetical protein
MPLLPKDLTHRTALNFLSFVSCVLETLFCRSVVLRFSAPACVKLRTQCVRLTSPICFPVLCSKNPRVVPRLPWQDQQCLSSPGLCLLLLFRILETVDLACMMWNMCLRCPTSLFRPVPFSNQAHNLFLRAGRIRCCKDQGHRQAMTTSALPLRLRHPWMD